MGFDFSQRPGKRITDKRRRKDGDILVSIITPFYNGSAYFKETYYCVLNQTFPWFEWVIVDDGSEGNELSLLQKLTENDPRISVYSKENGGPASARNFAIDRARGEIIVSLDADDLIEPTFLETTYWALYFHPEAGWAYTDSVGFGVQEYEWKIPFSDEEMKKENFLIEVGTIRKKALLEAGKYDDREKFSHEDWRLWLQLMAEKYYPVHLGYFGAWYRRVEEGAYAYTLTDQERRSRARKKVAEVAAKITWKVEAVEYPRREEFNRYKEPKLSNFSQTVYQEHDKIRILMLFPWMQVGGADAFNLELVKRLDKNQYDISILTTAKGESNWRQQFEQYTDEVFELPSFLDIENYGEFISYFIKSREIDILLVSNSYHGYSIVPWLKVNFPNLAIVDYVHMEEWYWRNGGYARISGKLQGFLEKTYVCNEGTRKVMVDIFHRDPKDVETVYIGVDHKKYSADSVNYGETKKLLHIDEKRPCVLFPCRIHEQKRPYLMLAVAEKLKLIDNSIAFMVVGDGPMLDEIQNKVKEKKLEETVYFAGRQQDLRPFYKDSDITLICSIKEGLALTAYESCSMGVPVISSDVGGQGELINKKTGVLLPVMQEETEIGNYNYSDQEIMQYVNSILGILSDREAYKILCENCRKSIEEKFSLDIMIDKMEREFHTLCKDEQFIEKRRISNLELKEFQGILEEFVTIYNECELRDQEMMHVWESSEWLKGQCESLETALEERSRENEILLDEKGKLQTDYEKCVSMNQELLISKQQLDGILGSKSWKVCQKYMHFMEKSFIGRLIMKFRRLLNMNGKV